MGEKKVKDFQPPTEEPREGFSSEQIAEGLDRPGRAEIEGFTGESAPEDPDRTETKQDKAGAANQNG